MRISLAMLALLNAALLALVLFPARPASAAATLPLLDGCKSRDWPTCRLSLIASIFNESSLPSRVTPDYIVEMPQYAMHGESARHADVWQSCITS